MRRNGTLREKRFDELGLDYIIIAMVTGATVFLATILIAPSMISRCCAKSLIGDQLTYLLLISFNIALFASSIPLAIRTRRIVSERDSVVKGIVLLLDTVSVGTRTGSTIVEALRRASKMVPSRILREKINQGIAEMEFGDSIENALLKISKDMPKAVSESIKIMIPASKAGGRAGDVLLVARDFVRRLMMFAEVRKTSLSLYIYIALISIGIFEGGGVFLLYLISKLSTGQQGSIPFITANYIQTWLFLFVTGLLLSIFSSIFVAKIVRGKTKLFADYLSIFLFVNLTIIGLIPLLI
ncbi:MAG: type II secretion system F family protein [Fervidicoccaceae archaeon]